MKGTIVQIPIQRIKRGQWLIETPDPIPEPGMELEWVFPEDAPDDAIAHFQFTDPDFVEPDTQLTKDWTATLKKGDSLRLTLKKQDPRDVYYAVLITSENEIVYATGGNPPPKVQVGP